MIDLYRHIENAVKSIENGELPSSITKYVDWKSQYAILKPRVVVTIELTKGVTFDLDITEYFEKVVK